MKDDFKPTALDYDIAFGNDYEEEPGLTDMEMGDHHDSQLTNKKQKTLKKMKKPLNEANLIKLVSEAVMKTLREMDEMEPDMMDEGVDPEALCDNIMSQAETELGEDAERYRAQCLRLCQNFLNKHPEYTDIDDAYDAIMEEPEPERSRYMKLFHFQEWKQAATVDDLYAYQKSKGRWDDAKCQAWAENEYAKMHGEGSSEPAGLAECGMQEKIAEAVIKAIKDLLK